MSQWKEVSRAQPCPICGKDHWCTRNESAGIAICMRISNNRPKTFSSGDVGYVYNTGGGTRTVTATLRPDPPRATINCTKILSGWRNHPNRLSSALLAINLGVSLYAIRAYDPVYASDRHAWAFPMRDAHGDTVGIRLRNDAGRKWAVTGSRQGLFIPKMGVTDPVIVCEGPTSAAAGVNMGFFTIGLPSAGAGGPELCRLIRKRGIRRVVLVADNKVKADASEDIGIVAARRIAAQLPVESHCIMILPAKDLRDFVRFGGNGELLSNMIESSVWTYGKTNVQPGVV